MNSGLTYGFGMATAHPDRIVMFLLALFVQIHFFLPSNRPAIIGQKKMSLTKNLCAKFMTILSRCAVGEREMLLWKSLVLRELFIVFFLLSSWLNAEVLELGEASVFGKKEQPGSIPIISRAPLEDDVLIPKWEVSKKIKESVNDEIFSVRSEQ
ncbi:MAG TPA: hypothetical protein VEL47_00570 [Myxococcota bacterium]|nr:hypothetical protein [Myxococcota bacterium]